MVDGVVSDSERDDRRRDVGARISTLRTERGLSLSALARAAGIGKGSLSELEAGQRNPTLDTLYAVAGPLGVPLTASSARRRGPRATARTSPHGCSTSNITTTVRRRRSSGSTSPPEVSDAPQRTAPASSNMSVWCAGTSSPDPKATKRPRPQANPCNGSATGRTPTAPTTTSSPSSPSTHPASPTAQGPQPTERPDSAQRPDNAERPATRALHDRIIDREVRVRGTRTLLPETG